MPPKERSERSENKTDGFDFELYTKVYFIDAFRSRDDIFDYEIGKGSTKEFGALDDVVVTVTLRDNRKQTFAMQAKQTLDNSKLEKQISAQDLWDACGKKNYYVAKYFASYLKIKEHIAIDQLKEMIIWTTQNVAKTAENLFEPYVPDSADDILKPAGTIQRWKLDTNAMVHPEYGDLKQLLLDEVHPLKNVVDKFIAVMFKKETWNSQKGANSCYRAMANQVIDCGNKIFQDRFIRGDSSLHPDTQIFRRIFERAMKVRIEKFSMELLNREEYKQKFILCIDNQFTKGNGQCSWNVGEVSVTIDDVEDFIKKFVLYVNVPKVTEFRDKLKWKFGEKKFKELCDLVRPCTSERMSNKNEIDAIFDLVELRSKMDLKCDPVLKFDGDDGELRRCLTNGKNLFVEAAQDVDCSVNRVFTTEEFEKMLLPCLAFRYKNLRKHIAVLAAVTKQSEVCKHGLKCIIISGIDVQSVENVKKTLDKFEGKIIFFCGALTKEEKDKLESLGLFYFMDEFDVGKLTAESKSQIYCKQLDVFGKDVTVEELLADFVMMENYKLALKLYRHPDCESFKLGWNELILDPYFDSRLKELDEYFGSPIIICDHAGMGKTTEIFHIAEKIRNNNLDCLTVYLDCKAAVKLFREDRSDGNSEKLMNVVCKMIHADLYDYQQLMVKEMFRTGRVFLLMDGYDEVSDESQKSLEEMIVACTAANLRGLCIATRPHCLDKIKQKLSKSMVRIFKLHPFTEDEQLKYLMKVWNISSNQQDKQVKENAINLLKSFQTILKHEGLLGIPLQMKMISIVYGDEIKSDQFELPKSFQVGSILEKFVQKRLDMTIEKYKSNGKAQEIAFQSMRKEFPVDHVNMALSVFRGKPDDSKELFEKNETYGLVRFNPFIAFSHDTYLHYFLALHFLTNRSDDQEFKRYMKQYLCPNRVDVATKFMDFHIGNSINEDALTCLRKRFKEYLEKSCKETERFTMIRNSLNATAFNVFELLYGALPEADLEKLQFRFGGGNNQNENRHLINLKRLGGDQTLQLLSVLLRQHGATFVKDILENFRDDEEDYIEVACRKPFLQVFQWLFDRVPELIPDEQTSLGEYVRKRITGYLKLLIQHNNASTLWEIIVWAKKERSREELNTLLEINELLLVFVSNVGLKTNNKDLVVESRIDMVRIVNDFCKWIYNDKIPLTEECLNNIKIIEQEEIRNELYHRFHTASE